jgi:multidrug resistance protein, MATE family
MAGGGLRLRRAKIQAPYRPFQMANLQMQDGDPRTRVAVPVDSTKAWAAELKQLVVLGSPIVLALFFQMSMGVLDTIMAGRVSAADLAGVALGGNVLWPTLLLLNGTLMALTPTVAQLFGACRLHETGETVRQGFWVAIVVAFASIVLVVNAGPFYRLIGADPAAVAITTGYLSAIAFGLPGFLFYLVLRCFCDGLGRTMPAMVVAGCAVMIKLVLNWTLIYGHFGFPALGGVGCGYATAVVMWFQALAMLFVVRQRAFRASGLFERFSWPDWSRVSALMRLGVPIGLTSFFEVAAFSTVTLLISRFGAEYVAGHQIAMSTNAMAFMIPLGIGMAATIRVGHELGAGRPRGARRAAATAMAASIAFAVVAAALIVLGNEAIAGFASRETDVARLAASLILFVSVFLVVDSAQATAVGALRGYKDTRVPMLIALFGFWGVALPLGAVLGFGWIGPVLGVYGFWVGLAVGLAVVAALLGIRLWRTTRVS